MIAGKALTEFPILGSVLHAGVISDDASRVTVLETLGFVGFANVARTENCSGNHDGTEVLGEHCNERSSVVVEVS
jgi:hypothetical protein